MEPPQLDPAERLVTALKAREETISVAESCTGGLIGARLTAVAGASEVFWGGVISYDDAAKRELLGVSDEALALHGAVSADVAKEMSSGMRDRAGTTWSIAVTGIAGPGGGTAEKPVGTIWIALAGPRHEARRYRFGGDRKQIRDATADAAIEWLEEVMNRRGEAGVG